MTRDEARQYFRDKGLTYSDISRTGLSLLGVLINLNFAEERAAAIEAGKEPYWLRVNSSRYYRGEWTETGAMVCAFLTGKGEHFATREVVSFYRSGMILFCGGASERNAQPVLDAFVEWCDEMAAQKEMTKEVSP